MPLLEAIDLEDITIHEDRARRVSWGAEPDETFKPPEPTLTMAIRHDANRLHFRFRIVIADQFAEYVADHEGVYVVASAESIEVTPELRSEFARKVAFMAIYPFIRVAVFAGAGRIGCPRPVLGLVRQGEFEMGDEMSAEDTRATFFDNRSELDRTD